MGDRRNKQILGGIKMVSKPQKKKLFTIFQTEGLRVDPYSAFSGEPAEIRHHVFKRRFNNTAWDIKNGMSLTRIEHNHAEEGFEERVKEVFIRRYSEHEYNELHTKSQEISRSLNFVDLKEELEKAV